jgi:predicted  nucleic acid-binding Zn-ribbon protein
MRLNNQSYDKDLCQNPLNRFGFEELQFVKNKLLKMTSLDEQILVVEKDIEKVEIKIQAVEKATDDCTDLEEKKQLRDEKKQLRDKETQLRDKEKQLRDEKLILLKAQHHPTGINMLDG